MFQSLLCCMQYHIGQRYNGTWLYFGKKLIFKQQFNTKWISGKLRGDCLQKIRFEFICSKKESSVPVEIKLMHYTPVAYICQISFVGTFLKTYFRVVVSFIDLKWRYFIIIRRQSYKIYWHKISRWRHQMETFSALLTICAGNSPVPGEFPVHKCQWHGALMFSLICVWINSWVINREAGDLRRYRAHYGVIVMCYDNSKLTRLPGYPRWPGLPIVKNSVLVIFHKNFLHFLWYNIANTLQYTAYTLFTRSVIQAQIKENIKAPRHWAMWG